MKQITTTENRTYEVADIIGLAIDKWGIKINYMVNHTASQGKTIIREVKLDSETVVLRGYSGHFFLEYYKGATMYPSVYSVEYTEKVEITEDEYQAWLKNRK